MIKFSHLSGLMGFLTALTLTFGASAQFEVSESAFPEAEVQATVDRYVALRERLDRGEAQWVEVADFFTDDAVFIDPVWGRIEGIDAIRKLYTDGMSAVDFTFPIDFIIISGNRVLIRWRQVLPGAKPDGSPWQQPAMSTLLYAGNGKFRYEEDLMNMAHVMEDIQASGWTPKGEFHAPPTRPDRNFSPEPTAK